jgi:hypothetical protein
MRSRASLLGFVLLVLTPLSSSADDGAPNESLFAVLSGQWRNTRDASGCTHHRHEIAFTDDHRTMGLGIQHSNEGSSLVAWESEQYQVLQTSPGFRVKRVDVVEPDVWELIVVSHDRLCWHPTDGSPGVCDRSFERCVP